MQGGLDAHASGIGRACKWDWAVVRYVASLKGHHDVVLCLLSAQRGRAAHSPAEAEAEAVGTAAPTVRAKNRNKPTRNRDKPAESRNKAADGFSVTIARTCLCLLGRRTPPPG